MLILFLGKPLFVKRPPLGSDIAHIRSDYEGLQGLAGPYCKVGDIEDLGLKVEFVGKTQHVYRQYRVTLRRPNHPTEVRMIKIEVTWLDIFQEWSSDLRRR